MEPTSKVSQKMKNIQRKKFKNLPIKNIVQPQSVNTHKNFIESADYDFYLGDNKYQICRIGIQLPKDHKYFSMNKYDIIKYFSMFWLEGDSNNGPKGKNLDENLKNEFFSYTRDINYSKYDGLSGPFEHNNPKRNRAIKCHDGDFYIRMNFIFNYPFNYHGLEYFCCKMFINKLKSLNGDCITIINSTEYPDDSIKNEQEQRRAIIYMREYTKIMKYIKSVPDKDQENNVIYKNMCDKFLSEKPYANQKLIDELVYDELTLHEENFDFGCW